MSNFPHNYKATASVSTTSNVQLDCDGCPGIESAPPTEFGGPGDKWSPEDLLVGAVADCFVLSFKAIAGMSKFEWTSLKCTVDGTLDKVERDIQFTGIQVNAELVIPEGADADRAQKLLEKAEATCFITNSLKAEPHLEASISHG